MPGETTPEGSQNESAPKPLVSREEAEKFKEKILKAEKQSSTADFVQALATREKLERDFKEDRIAVTFNTSPETKRTILARRPNKKEFLEILNLSIQAAKFEGLGDTKSLEKLYEIYGGLNEIAAKLCVDKTLNKDFWDEHISFNALQSFIGEVINASQQLGASGISEADMKKFRRE